MYISGMFVLVIFTSRFARGRLVLRLLCVFRVCWYMYLFVRPHLSRAQ